MRVPSVAILIGASLCVSVPAFPVEAHGGGLNAQGCHNNRKTGGYHCHRGTSSSPRSENAGTGPKRGGGAWRNCSEARAAGAAPVLRGEAGYGPHLDRDDDGVGCE